MNDRKKLTMPKKEKKEEEYCYKKHKRKNEKFINRISIPTLLTET
jgi:hypothetical protein